ncbi:gamma-aminobutyric acid receptor alpha-like isoform X2 [Nematostella vectensis]|nr:gamma-aminobutyric acid receptor alpha-like isoform X2 [Nematostella vectensis]XP_048578841.1 gamma-aminobutyric acid receptor alpha-like isoform X2 [Nematostella vectensis]
MRVQILLLVMAVCINARSAQGSAFNALDAEKLKVLDESNTIAGRNMSKLLKLVLVDYDKNIRPFYGVKPIKVMVDILILSFGEIQEADMVFTMDIYLGQFWQDPRFAFGLNKTVSLGGLFVDRFWIPDTFFVNSVDTEIHKMISPNKKVWLNLDQGHIMLSTRLKSRATCKMDLRKYPMDLQTCHLALESFSFDEEDLMYEWKKPVGSDVFIYDAEMAQFTVVNVKRKLKHPLYHSRRFSGMTVTFKFQRRTMYYIFQMYIPCVCIVALSWVSFWVDADAVPARVGLSITTVLTICYMLGSVNSNLPRVSYLKAIDYFLLLSFGFIFLTLVEYVFVLKYAKRKRFQGSFCPEKKFDHEVEEEWPEDHKMMQVRIQIGKTAYSFTDSISTLSSTGTNKPVNGDIIRTTPKKPIRTCNHSRPMLRKVTKSGRKDAVVAFFKRHFRGQEWENWIDKCSRLLFPFFYGVFLLVYFVYFFCF